MFSGKYFGKTYFSGSYFGPKITVVKQIFTEVIRFTLFVAKKIGFGKEL